MTNERFDSFDLLRAVGALLVLVSHSFALTGRPEPVVPGVASYGGLGVAIFFSISGYLITLSWHRDPRLGAFLVKRSLRIFPALFVVVLLAAFVLGPWSAGSRPPSTCSRPRRGCTCAIFACRSSTGCPACSRGFPSRARSTARCGHSRSSSGCT